MAELNQMLQFLQKLVADKPKRKPEWNEDTGHNLDDAYTNGYDICAWGVAEAAENVLKDYTCLHCNQLKPLHEEGDFRNCPILNANGEVIGYGPDQFLALSSGVPSATGGKESGDGA